MGDTSRYLAMTWYPVVNDAIGGWSVSTLDLPLTDAVEQGGLWVLDTETELIARHVSGLHNEWLEDMAPDYRDTRHPFRDGGMGGDHDWPELAQCECGRERWEDVHVSHETGAGT